MPRRTREDIALDRAVKEAGGETGFFLSTLSRTLAPARSPFSGVKDFLRRGCWTVDEATGRIVQFPSDERHEYLYLMCDVIDRYKLIAVEKSRRMMATWLMVCWLLFDTLTQQHHANFVVSKKLEDSAFLLGDNRMLGVYDRIPKELWRNKPSLIPSGKEGDGFERLSCPETGSFIRAVAQGADQLRQYTATNVLFDEFAFQERQREAWTAVKPTAEGGGRIMIISTPELGAYMHDLIYDTEAEIEAAGQAIPGSVALGVV